MKKTAKYLKTSKISEKPAKYMENKTS